jgi:hypothetical protein
MYTLTGREVVTQVRDLPSPGLPSEPCLMAEEHRAALGYRIAISDLAWRPPTAAADLGGSEEVCAILRITSPAFIIWTPYSQEGLAKHPLTKFGLRWFSVFEVANSSLIDPHPVLTRRHLIFQFEDSTLDIVCEAVQPFRFGGSGAMLSGKVAAILAEGAG